MNNSNKVGEIFTSAGSAFLALGDLTKQLSSSQSNSSSGVAKWTEEEVDMLQKAVNAFAEDLEKISKTIKLRTVQQIKGALKKKAYDEAGLSPTTSLSSSDANVTLNMLNAGDNEVDVEELESRLDFDQDVKNI
ncbi:BPTF-associated chromatin complex component 1 isoform X1 [Lepeophtheirus salmonis]|uniref:AGAP009888PAlike [Tribolium castaneum] n=1 Tax=Lepeophtheirus salmonis TaxID=72036 RepID=C1BS30_LEPSM|nr:chromatin complexes subunit BAP18-like [Lepeophtheirus salmonis]ACO11833.1 potential DNA-binding protein C17orf49 [Lepeophtheirus salmonis]ADD38388.1 potential DNA-binding protein C17orf49 [Lepeophtheirus salmonis]